MVSVVPNFLAAKWPLAALGTILRDQKMFLPPTKVQFLLGTIKGAKKVFSSTKSLDFHAKPLEMARKKHNISLNLNQQYVVH